MLTLVTTLILGWHTAGTGVPPGPAEPPVSATRIASAGHDEPKTGVADEPKIVSLEPANSADDLDAEKTTKLIVVFDRPMRDTTWSFCGGGPSFPVFKGKPHWDTPTKIVVDVTLEPDHEYRLGLNCPSASNFIGTNGVPLAPTPWSFTTAPSQVTNPAQQKAENQRALDALMELLPRAYSYYDLRVHDWDRLLAENKNAILGAKTKRAWATAAAKMLADTEDVHLSLQLGDMHFAAGSRTVDTAYRAKLLPRYFPVQPVGATGLQGRTIDSIGYVMIGGWTDAKEVDAVEQALASLRDCKALVVDVRPNAGGDEVLARRIAAWFVDGSKVYGKHRLRMKAGKDGFGPLVDRVVEGNLDVMRRMRVPIAVLTSRYVVSSDESFVLMMRQAPDCTVVGQRTYGSSGNPKPHELPNGVTARIPSWKDLRPDGTCFEGEGLSPDVEVAVTAADLEQKDPILERALAVLREKLPRGG